MRIKSRPSFKDIIVLNHKQEKPEWELLAESGNVQLDKLISIYNENPFYARVIYKQKKLITRLKEWLRLDLPMVILI
jgi:hypothetical protein